MNRIPYSFPRSAYSTCRDVCVCIGQIRRRETAAASRQQASARIGATPCQYTNCGTYIHIYVCMHACIHTYIPAYIQTYIHI